MAVSGMWWLWRCERTLGKPWPARAWARHCPVLRFAVLVVQVVLAVRERCARDAVTSVSRIPTAAHACRTVAVCRTHNRLFARSANVRGVGGDVTVGTCNKGSAVPSRCCRRLRPCVVWAYRMGFAVALKIGVCRRNFAADATALACSSSGSE